MKRRWPRGNRKESDEAYRRSEAGKARQRRYRAKPKYKRMAVSYTLKVKYGITIEDKEKMYERQMGLCALCGRHLSPLLSQCATEHRHSDGKIRGLVHQSCNLFIAKVENNPRMIQRIVEYLKK